MARIFSIYFTYDDSLRSAIVSVRQLPEQTEFVLGNLDEEIYKLLPGNTLVLSPAGSLFFKDQPVVNEPAELINTVIESLAQHLAAAKTFQ